MKRILKKLCICGTIWIFLTETVEAHLVNTGFGPFYNGLCHPFVNPVDLMMIVSLALLAGIAGPASGRKTLFCLTLAWMAGLGLGHFWLKSSTSIPALSAAMIFGIAILVTSNLRCPLFLLATLGVLIGVIFGISNGGEFVSLGNSVLPLFGVITSVFVLMSCVTAISIKNHSGWRHIVIRVLGSWIAAASLLMIGWELRSRYMG